MGRNTLFLSHECVEKSPSSKTFHPWIYSINHYKYYRNEKNIPLLFYLNYVTIEWCNVGGIRLYEVEIEINWKIRNIMGLFTHRKQRFLFNLVRILNNYVWRDGKYFIYDHCAISFFLNKLLAIFGLITPNISVRCITFQICNHIALAWLSIPFQIVDIGYVTYARTLKKFSRTRKVFNLVSSFEFRIVNTVLLY